MPAWARCRQVLRILALAAGTAAILGPAAPADSELVAPPSEAPAFVAWPLAPGPAGRALSLAPRACDDCGGRIAERDSSGRWTLQAIMPADLALQAVAWGPGDAAVAMALVNTGTGGMNAFFLRRPPGALTFGAPVAIDVGGVVWEDLRPAFDVRGDLAFLTAVKGPDAVVRLVAVSAAPGDRFGAPQVLVPGSSIHAGIAVGGGRLAVAYLARGKVYARTGTVGAALGPPQMLGGSGLGEIAVAVDDAGTATVAFSRGTQSHHELVVTRAPAHGRFHPPAVLGRSDQRRAFGADAQATAAGTTTALVWTIPHAVPWAHAAIARGTGRFAAADMPSAHPLTRARALTRGNPHDPRLAVDPEGDVLLTYTFGFPGGVHATVRRAGAAGFGPLHVVSRLGEGGSSSVAWLSERRPLIIYHGRSGELLASTQPTGPPPDLTPPRLTVKYAPDARRELRATNAVTVTIRCSEPCVLQTRAGLRTRQGRTSVDGVDGKLLDRGATFTERFAFDPERGAGRAEGGARAHVTVTAQNASGAARTTAGYVAL